MEVGINKTCAQCYKPLIGKRSDAKYCSPACKKSAHRAGVSPKIKSAIPRPKVVCIGSHSSPCDKVRQSNKNSKKAYQCRVCAAMDRPYKYLDNYFNSFHYINSMTAIKSAGTFQTFPGLNDLNHYTYLGRLQNKFEGYSRAGRVVKYNRCHLVATKDQDRVGLSNKWNVFIGEATENKQLGNQAVFTRAEEGTHFLCRDELKREWMTAGKDSKQLKQMFVDYFGEELLANWAAYCEFKPQRKLTKEQRIKKLMSDQERPNVAKAMLFPVVLFQMIARYEFKPVGVEEQAINRFMDSWLDKVEIASKRESWKFHSNRPQIEAMRHYESVPQLEGTAKKLQAFILTGDLDKLYHAQNELKNTIITGSDVFV